MHPRGTRGPRPSPTPEPLLGDAAAFDAVFHAHYAPLCAYAALFTGSVEAAEEVAQDVLFELWRRRASFVIDTDLRSYLYRAVRNRALNAVRRARSEGRLTSGLAHDAVVTAGAWESGGTDIEERLCIEEMHAAIQRAIDRLPERSRAVSLLRWRHGLSHREIAARLGIQVKSVELQVGRALKVLRRRLPEL
jgi:RNA polymerase sigma-70 factor (ECF subfamily)